MNGSPFEKVSLVEKIFGENGRRRHLDRHIDIGTGLALRDPFGWLRGCSIGWPVCVVIKTYDPQAP